MVFGTVHDKMRFLMSGFLILPSKPVPLILLPPPLTGKATSLWTQSKSSWTWLFYTTFVFHFWRNGSECLLQTACLKTGYQKECHIQHRPRMDSMQNLLCFNPLKYSLPPWHSDSSNSSLPGLWLCTGWVQGFYMHIELFYIELFSLIKKKDYCNTSWWA